MFSLPHNPDNDTKLPAINDNPSLRRRSDSALAASFWKINTITSFPSLANQQPPNTLPQKQQTSSTPTLPPIAVQQQQRPPLRRSLSRTLPRLSLGLGWSFSQDESELSPTKTFGAVGVWGRSLVGKGGQAAVAAEPVVGIPADDAKKASGMESSSNEPNGDVEAQRKRLSKSAMEWLKNSGTETEQSIEENTKSNTMEDVRQDYDAPLPEAAGQSLYEDSGNAASQSLHEEIRNAVGQSLYEDPGSKVCESSEVQMESQVPQTSISTNRPPSRLSITIQPEMTKDLNPSTPRSTQTPTPLRKRRSGWWDAVPDKESERRRIIDLVRGSPQASISDSDKLCSEQSDDHRDDTPGSGAEGDASEEETDTQPQTFESERALRLWRRNSSVGIKSVFGMEEDVWDKRRSKGGEQKKSPVADTLRPVSPQTHTASPPASLRNSHPPLRRSMSTIRKSALKLFGIPNPKDSTGTLSPQPTPIPTSSSPSPKSSLSGSKGKLKHVESMPIIKVLPAAAEKTEEHGAEPTEAQTERALKARIRELETQLSQIRQTPQNNLTKLITDIDQNGESNIPRHFAIHCITQYCLTQDLEKVVEALENEDGETGRIARGLTLRRYLKRRRFGDAVALVEGVMGAERAGELVRVLRRWNCLWRVEKGDMEGAQKALNKMIGKEDETELERVREVVEGSAGEGNPYVDVDLDEALKQFWDAGLRWSRMRSADGNSKHDDGDKLPLYASALGEFFCCENCGDVEAFDGLYAGYTKWKEVCNIIGEDIPVSSGRTRNRNRSTKKVERSARRREEKKEERTQITPDVADNKNPETPPKPPPKAKSPSPSPTYTPVIPPRTVSISASRPQSTRPSPKKSRRESLEPTSADRDRHSTHSSTFSFTPADDLPPLPVHPSSSDFALSTICGPTPSTISALDITSVPETGQIIAATAGSNDRSDKKIWIWDVRAGVLVAFLDNGTGKSVTALSFGGQSHHNEDDTSPYEYDPNENHYANEYLLSADMEFNVKLWDWRNGVCLRVWRKLHSRIVFRVLSIPGDHSRAATCSADQSIKLLTLTTTSNITSIHANEPITSIAIIGSPTDPTHQKLVASLSYSLRIYKLRTAALISVIQLRELRGDKTPITSVEAHPTDENFVLLSTDNHLVLYNLTTQTSIKNFQSRLIPPGIRISGGFSPCGGWVYAGCWDVRGKKYDLAEGDGSGVVVWKVHGSAKGEVVECGTAVSFCKWGVWRSGQKGEGERKCLVVVGVDGVLRMFL